MPQNLSGIRITDLYPMNDTGAKLKVDDILIEVDGLPVASDGSIPFRENERIMLSYALTSRFLGEEVPVKVLRRVSDGEPPQELSFDIRLDEVEHLVPAHLYDKTPQYVKLHAGPPPSCRCTLVHRLPGRGRRGCCGLAAFCLLRVPYTC